MITILQWSHGVRSIPESPQQALYLRLGLQAYSPEGEPSVPWIAQTFWDHCPAWCRWTLPSSSVSCTLALGAHPCPVFRWAELNPRLALFLPHALCRRPVKDADIRWQSRKGREQGRDWLWPWRQTGLQGGKENQEIENVWELKENRDDLSWESE